MITIYENKQQFFENAQQLNSKVIVYEGCRPQTDIQLNNLGIEIDYVIYKNASLQYSIPSITLEELEEIILEDTSKPFSIIVTANALWFANTMQDILKKRFDTYNISIFSLVVPFEINEGYIITKQKELDILQNRLNVYKKLEKQFKNIMQKVEVPTYTEKPAKIIWTCWLQGIENAPPVVQSCYRTIRSSFPEYKKVLITAENFGQYIDMDIVILEKWKKGIISNTMFSDIIRLELLIKYGGVWLDSTILCTSNQMPKFIEDNSLFMYVIESVVPAGDVRSTDNWLISSCKNHIMLKTIRDFLINYWHQTDELVEYFIFHMFFQIVIEIYPDIWESVPKISNVIPLIMVQELENKFDKAWFDYLGIISPFHKLTYKLAPTVLENKSNYYNYIIKNF
ncbi:MAG: hypothetical protein ATN35_01820 [Epulopiscium sp. Nele67-Bin004]|nr:MAG: hypothetical protein ATN35_01820 [Epulopiscium sp. Nele67-Bin004]